MAGEGEFLIRIESAPFIACMKVDFSAKFTNAEILIDGNGISGNNFGTRSLNMTTYRGTGQRIDYRIYKMLETK